MHASEHSLQLFHHINARIKPAHVPNGLREIYLSISVFCGIHYCANLIFDLYVITLQRRKLTQDSVLLYRLIEVILVIKEVYFVA